MSSTRDIQSSTRDIQSSTRDIQSSTRDIQNSTEDIQICTSDNGRRRRQEEEDIRDTPVVIWKEPNTSYGGLQEFKAERASALRRNRICPTTPSRRERLQQEVEELVPALLRLHNLSLFEFLNVVEEYGTPEEVLDLLFAKYRRIVASCKKEGIRDQWEIAMTSFMTIWLDYYEEDFHDPPEFPALTKLLKFTGQYVPGSVLDCRAERYLCRFVKLHQVEFEGGDDTLSADPKQHPEPPQEHARASTVGPAAPSGSQGMELVPAAGAERSARGLTSAAVYKVRHVAVTPLNPWPELEEPPAPLGALEAERAPPPAMEVIDVPVEQPASDSEQQPEPPQEPARAPTVGPAAPSRAQGKELVPAGGAECSARGLTSAAVYKVRPVVVRPLNPWPELEEPPAPLGALEAERAPPPAMEVIDVPVEQPASDSEQQPEPPQEPARAPTVGPAAPSRAQGKELVPAGGAECSARGLTSAAVYKVRPVVVRPLNPWPELEEPPAPLGALEAERAPPPAIEVIDVAEQPPHSGATGFGPRATP
ncbi:Ral guanine nucleotide dissociation stimulator [Vulpes lagopus]